MEVNAPFTVVSELMFQKQKDRLLVHLLNYDLTETQPVNNVEVNLQVPAGKKAGKVSLLSPMEGDLPSLPSTLKDGRLSFTVPRLKTYVVARIQLE